MQHSVPHILSLHVSHLYKILVQIVKFESKCNALPFQDGNWVFPRHLWGEAFIDIIAARSIGQITSGSCFPEH